MIMDSIPKQLVEKLELCGLSRAEAFGIYHKINSWLQNNGAEWTVQHLKLVKQTVLALQAEYSKGTSPYVKTRNRRLVGPFRAVQRLLERGDKRALQALMVYTNFVSPVLTEKQKDKFISAVTTDKPDFWYELSDETLEYIGKYSHDKFPTLEQSYDESEWSDNKFAPVLGGKTIVESDKASQLEHFVHSDVYRSIYNAAGQLLPEDLAWFQDNVLVSAWPKPKGRGPIGRISILQEPGFKARFIANPNRIIQHALTPLGDFLFGLLKRIPWDCTFEQSRAQAHIVERLRAKKHVHCYDLSNATDMFPMRTQVENIFTLFSQRNGVLEEDVSSLASQLRIFSEVSRSTWSFQGENLSWSRGQPLGLYPSFAMFAFTHGALLLDISFKLSRTHRVPLRFREDFFVVGDDVVILDDELAHLYERTLRDLEIPFSESKSIVSDILAEFVGEVITRDRVFVPVKWRQVSTKSFGDFIKVWGYEAIPLLPGHIRDVAYAYAEAPEPVGLGLNPKGKPLGERIDHLIDLYLDTFVPPVRRAGDEYGAFRNAFKFYEETCRLEYTDLSYFRTKIISVPAVGRTDRRKAEFLSSLEFADMLTKEDLTEYVKYLVGKGSMAPEDVSDFSDIEFGEDEPSRNSGEAFYRKFKNMLSGK